MIRQPNFIIAARIRIEILLPTEREKKQVGAVEKFLTLMPIKHGRIKRSKQAGRQVKAAAAGYLCDLYQGECEWCQHEFLGAFEFR